MAKKYKAIVAIKWILESFDVDKACNMLYDNHGNELFCNTAMMGIKQNKKTF